MVSATTRTLRGQLGAIRRHHPDQDDSSIARDLAASVITDYVVKVVDSAPPLTDEQCDRIASLLRSGR